jgi:hypothetical protein
MGPGDAQSQQSKYRDHRERCNATLKKVEEYKESRRLKKMR